MLLSEGLKFTSKWFKGIVKINNMNKEKNILNVHITTSSRNEWDEEWGLRETIWGFEKGDYKLLSEQDGHLSLF